MKPFLLLLFCAASFAATTFRVDPSPVMTTAGTPPIGGFPALYAVAGASISLCTDAACATPATAYTDATGNTACPINAPVVLAGTVLCTSSTGPQGQFGFWVAPGTYYYKVTFPGGQSFGNFPITGNTAGVTSVTAGTGISVTNGGVGSVTVSNTGIITISAGTGIGSTGGQNPTLSNTGVISVAAGTGISASGTNPATIANTGVISVAGGTGISTSGTNPATITNTGVVSFNSRTGAVVPATNDYTYTQIGGAKQGNTNVPQMAGTNSGVTGAPLCDDVNGNATTSGCSLLPSATAQLQYLRTKPNSGNITTLEFSAFPSLISTDYNFPAQQPGGSLTASVGATVTMSPCPLGVNGADVGHRIYISGGAGAAEAALITGGTCTTGANSGTIIFTPANNHSGAWTVASATSGIQEASQQACTAGTKRVLIPGGSFTNQARVSLPCSLSIRGAGNDITTVAMATGYTDRAFEIITPTGASLDFGDLTISYTTNGASNEGLYIQEVTDGVVSNLSIVHSYDGITGVSVGRVNFIACNLFPINNGYNFSSIAASSVIGVSVPNIFGGFVTMASSVAGTVVNLGPTIAGMNIVGLESGLGAFGIRAVCSTGAINEVSLTGSIIDSYGTDGLDMIPTGSCQMSRWIVNGNKFAGAGAGNSLGWQIKAAVAGNILGFSATGNTVQTQNAGSTIVNMQGVTGAVIASNVFNMNTAGGNGILLDGVANSNIDIRSNNIGSNGAYANTPGSAVAIFINNQAHTGVTISGNTLTYSSAAITNLSTVANGVQWNNNRGITDIVPAVASAATLAFPINPNFTVTGTTGVTAVSGLFTGGTGTLTTAAAGFTFTAGATIGNTCAIVTNKLYSWFFDGTKVWLAGNGC